MNTLNPRSDRGVVLIIVLLLMAVLGALTTAMTVSGHTEITMAGNELSYAGARAAAEAGLSRATNAIVKSTNIDLKAKVADKTWKLDSMLAGGGASPYDVDGRQQYRYSVALIDDADPTNKRLVLQATGTGPNGTTVVLSRFVDVTDSTTLVPGPNDPLGKASVIINGDIEIRSDLTLEGSMGSLHANGNITLDGYKPHGVGGVTATGTIKDVQKGKTVNNKADAITVPDIHASAFKGRADVILAANGTRVYGDTKKNRALNRVNTACVCSAWVLTAPGPTDGGVGKWTLGNSYAGDETYYVEGNVAIGEIGSNGAASVTVIATGNIDVSNGDYLPSDPGGLQFVTDGDLHINNHGNPANSREGLSLVRRQFEGDGDFRLNGQLIVQDDKSATSMKDLVKKNMMEDHGIYHYDGTKFDVPELQGPPTTVTTYANNVSGWMEK